LIAARLAHLAEGRPPETAQICAVSQAEAAGKLKVSRRLTQDAKAVIERGTPELVKAVERGDLRVTPAAAVAALDPGEQAALVAKGPVAVRARASKRRATAKGRGAGPARRADGATEPGAGPEPAASSGLAPGVISPEELLPDRRWLESFPLRARLADPTAFDREATLWHVGREVCDRLPPAGDTRSPVRLFLTGTAPSDLLTRVRPPAEWTACRRCSGRQVDRDGGPCGDCAADGFRVRLYTPTDPPPDQTSRP
jgi:hypothetical protein